MEHHNNTQKGDVNASPSRLIPECKSSRSTNREITSPCHLFCHLTLRHKPSTLTGILFAQAVR